MKGKEKSSTLDKKIQDECIKTVIGYYKNHGRHDLSWRKKITPYSILVSEVMLQQTQVGRVVEKYALWMKKYPTLTALSKSSLQEVLVLWQGLGYQRRAKALYTIAQENKTLPKTYEGLLALPGIGTYTASAICAFAYDMFTYPVLETNIRTVFIEYFLPDKDGIDDSYLALIGSGLEEDRRVKELGAREWYYALMDYGAYLKANRISHNEKAKGHRKQTPFKGSLREIRAKVLFAITHGEMLPEDKRIATILTQLEKELFIVRDTSSKSGYRVN